MRIGIFGGTFDPVHLGHLILAEQCREQGELDQVLFVPAARPPHKLDRTLTPFHHRLEMLELAIAGNPAFRVSRIEEERPGPSYTVHTLETLRMEDPSSEFFLIMGADTLIDLRHWYQPKRIVELSGMMVVSRPGSTLISSDSLKASLGLPEAARVQLRSVVMPLVEISSSSIRDRVPEGRSIRYEVPRAVEMYVREKQLYMSQ